MYLIDEILSGDYVLPDDEDEAAAEYKRIAKLIHPDVCDEPGATEAFTLLNVMFNKVGTFDATITTKRNTYTVVAKVPTFCGTVNRWRTMDNLIDIAVSPTYNSYIDAEYKVMQTFGDSSEPIWYPDLVENFQLKQGGVTRKGNVFRMPEGMRQLSTIPKLTTTHVIWIWRRLLKVIYLNQELGLIHGAIFPWSIWIHPIDRAVLLTDWRFSSKIDLPAPMSIVPKGTKGLYPKYVIEKNPPKPGLDIYLAAKAMLATASSTAPFLTKFLRGCSLEGGQPDDPLTLRDEFDKLLERRGEPYFPRRYTELKVH
jgi:serine/threonine protein kinase